MTQSAAAVRKREQLGVKTDGQSFRFAGLWSCQRTPSCCFSVQRASGWHAFNIRNRYEDPFEACSQLARGDFHSGFSLRITYPPKVIGVINRLPDYAVRVGFAEKARCRALSGLVVVTELL